MSTIDQLADYAEDLLGATGVNVQETGGDHQIAIGGQTLSVQKFHNNIRDALVGRCVGVAVMTFPAGFPAFSSWSGFSRTAADPPQQTFLLTRRTNLGGVSQTLTAIAVIQLLTARNLGLDATIAQYLPSDWQRGPNVDRITFKELLTHTSGIRDPDGNAVDYLSLKDMLARGTSADKSFQVQPQNFALFRILIPFLHRFEEGVATDKARALALARAYLGYMNASVFAPIGIPTVHAEPPSPNPTLAYPFPAGSEQGAHFGDATLIAGGTGIHLSIEELRLLLRKLRYSTQLLNAEQRQLMDDHQLGWFKSPVTNGFVFQQSGVLSSPTSNGTASLHTVLADFSVGVQTVVVHNSPVVPAPPGDLVVDAYNAAWEGR